MVEISFRISEMLRLKQVNTYDGSKKAGLSELKNFSGIVFNNEKRLV